MPIDELKLTRRGAVAILTIDRPSRRNAFHGPMWEALGELPDLLADDPPRVLVIHGTGAHFSAGMDLAPDNPLFGRLVPAIARQDEGTLEELVHELKACVDALAHLSCPTIAAVEGACAGGGLEVALACDLRVASTTAWFSLPELQVGFAPDVGGTVRLTRLIGRARATELILTGRRIDAATAEAWGLVNRTCAPGTALDAALALAAEVATSAPLATGAVLPVLRGVAGQTDDTAFHRETRAGVLAMLGGEVQEGAMAFLEKRRPSWVEEQG